MSHFQCSANTLLEIVDHSFHLETLFSLDFWDLTLFWFLLVPLTPFSVSFNFINIVIIHSVSHIKTYSSLISFFFSMLQLIPSASAIYSTSTNTLNLLNILFYLLCYHLLQFTIISYLDKWKRKLTGHLIPIRCSPPISLSVLWLSCVVLCLVTQLCSTFCDRMESNLPGSSVHVDSPGRNTGMGCHFLLQQILPTQGSNPGLLHCR